MKKQVLFTILMLLPFVAKADDSGTCGANLTWTYSEATKTLTISGSGEMYNYGLKDSAPWSKYGQDFQNLIIGDSVTSIGSLAFYCCSGLNSVTIGNSVTSIYHDAFLYCTGLTSVIIPNSVTYIGYSAFIHSVFRDLKTTTNNEKHI